MVSRMALVLLMPLCRSESTTTTMARSRAHSTGSA